MADVNDKKKTENRKSPAKTRENYENFASGRNEQANQDLILEGYA